MVQIHGKGRYKIIATQSIMVLIGGVSKGVSVLVSISQGGGIGNGSLVLVDDGLDGLGISDGGGVGHGGHGIGISHGGMFNLPVLSRSLFDDVGVDDGSNLLSISHGSGVSLRIVSISVVENLGISLGLSLSLSLVKAVECRNICRSIVDHRLVMGGISNGVVVVDIGSLVGVSHGGGIGDGRSLDLRGFVDHGVVVVDIRSLVDMGNMGLVHSGIGLSLHVDSRVMNHSSVVSDLSGLDAGGVHNGVGRGQSQKRSNNLSNKEKYE